MKLSRPKPRFTTTKLFFIFFIRPGNISLKILANCQSCILLLIAYRIQNSNLTYIDYYVTPLKINNKLNENKSYFN